MPPSPSRQMVTRKTFASTVVLLVVMMGASDWAVYDIARGPTAGQVKTQIDNEIARRSAVRDAEQAQTAKVARDRFCAVLSTVRRTALTNGIRTTLRCQASTPLQKPGVEVTIMPTAPNVAPTPSAHPSSKPTSSQHPTPRPTVTVTRTPRPPRPSPTPSCSLAHPLLCLL